MTPDQRELEVEIPLGATPAQEEALIQAAIDKKIDGVLASLIL